ncbi:MAG TPA: Ca2+-dependent phosphoinositide-specific phospholipase C [Chitinophagales bacterium]|nr:Ca2+-dependent phosphoinositide-specific phospholipase C [Chitinophagales bacterium]
MKSYVMAFACCLLFVASCKKETKGKDGPEVFDNGPTDSLKMNQVQIIASHNSYHLKTNDSIFNWMTNASALGLLPEQYNPRGIDYWHVPIEQQFDDYNVRGLELDIYNDPQGGNFYYRQGMSMVGLDNDSRVDILREPGFKIVHIPDFDFNTNYYTFKQALTTVYNWSVAHPNHLPIFINVETKNETVGDVLPSLPGMTLSIPFDASACDKMDEEIKSVFGELLDKVVTPDDVRGSYPTLEAAVLAGNWPTLAQARNKVVFIMQGGAESLYKAGHPSLQNRAMFVYSDPGTPEAAFVILNSPNNDKPEIITRVQQGYIVRTRADSGTDEAREGDYTDMNNSFESGAQIISTDYYRPDPRAGTPGWTDFKVQFPNGELARINQVSASSQTNLGLIKE